MTKSLHQESGTALNAEQMSMAVDLLRAGKLVAFPTETVYGLGADASNADALRLLYATKGRPSNHPVIVHIADITELSEWASDVPAVAYELAERFWPGPMTLIMKKNSSVLEQVTGGQETVGLRVPRHPIALELLRRFGGGIAAPSANKFGRTSPTKAEHVQADFASEISLVLDGGTCDVGIESTIIDLTADPVRVLRPGMLDLLELENIVTLATTQLTWQKSPPRVPGALLNHYAPATPLYLVSNSLLMTEIEKRRKLGQRVGVFSFELIEHDDVISIAASLDCVQYARGLYDCLRRLDRSNQSVILVEEPPRTLAWSGVWDRLLRAATKNGVVDGLTN